MIGDEVNLASRLEDLTKLYGLPLVVGERTAAQAPEMALFDLDLISVRGKSRPVAVYAVLGDEKRAQEPDFIALRQTQMEMLAAYRSQRFATAAELILDLRHMTGGQMTPLWDLYDRRIREYLSAPPPANWDGSAVDRRRDAKAIA